jgi:phosphate transport system permease protein
MRSTTFLTQNNNLFRRLRRFWEHGDRLWRWVLIIASLGAILLMVAIGLLLWNGSSGARSTFGLGFLLPTTSTSWNPVTSKFQAWPFIYGTLVTSLVALVIAVPVSLGIAIFLAELSPAWLRTPLSWLVELLAAVPSVVYGLWGIFVFLPVVVTPIGEFLQESLGQVPILSLFFSGPIPQSGASRLAASLILAIMIIPTITSVSRDVFLAIPDNQREASLALGSTRWESIWYVLIPYGLSGILGATILGLGRALGETMAVTMVIGNSTQGTLSLLRPGYTMSSIIANEFAEAVSEIHSEALIEIGLILFGLTLVLNMIARLLVWQVSRRSSQQEARA